MQASCGMEATGSECVTTECQKETGRAANGSILIDVVSKHSTGKTQQSKNDAFIYEGSLKDAHEFQTSGVLERFYV